MAILAILGSASDGNRKHVEAIGLAILLMLPACEQVLAPEKVEYKIQLEPGSEWAWNGEVHVLLEGRAQNQSLIITLPIALRMDLLVESVDDRGNYVVLGTIRKYNMGMLLTFMSESVSPRDVFGYDSDPPDEIANVVQGQTIQFKMGRDGAIISVDGLSAVRRQLDNHFRFRTTRGNSLFSAQDQRELREVFLIVFDDDFIPGMLESTFHTLPSTPVAVGDSWRVMISNPLTTERSEYVLKLDSRENGVANFTHAQLVDEDELAGVGAQATVEEGTVVLDEATGMPIRHQQHVRVQEAPDITQYFSFKGDVQQIVEVVPKR